MADTVTTNYEFVKPEIGASTNTWGAKLNADLDSIDALLKQFFDDMADLSGVSDDATARANLGLGSMAVANTADYTPTSGLSAVATSGAYADLAGTPVLSAVATSGDYGDLSNTPISATATELRAGTANRVVNADVAVAAMNWVALTYAATINIDHRDGCCRTIVATGNPAIAAPTNGLLGLPLAVAFKQDATGGRVPTWNAAFLPGDLAAIPTPDLGTNQETIFYFRCRAAGKYVLTGISRRTE